MAIREDYVENTRAEAEDLLRYAQEEKEGGNVKEMERLQEKAADLQAEANNHERRALLTNEEAARNTPIIVPGGDPVTSPTPTTQPAQAASEVTGVRTLVARLNSIAGTHAAISGNESFLGSLATMEVGEEDQQLVRDAQEASRNAEQAWMRAAQDVAAHNLPLAEQYSLNPQAGNKHANTNE